MEPKELVCKHILQLTRMKSEEPSMKILYTNISPITNAYTNINHLFYLKSQNPQKVYLCVWDNYVFENNILDQHDENSKKETLENNVKLLQKVMDHLNINYRI